MTIFSLGFSNSGLGIMETSIPNSANLALYLEEIRRNAALRCLGTHFSSVRTASPTIKGSGSSELRDQSDNFLTACIRREGPVGLISSGSGSGDCRSYLFELTVPVV